MQHLLRLSNWQEGSRSKNDVLGGYLLVLVNDGHFTLHCQQSFEVQSSDLILLPAAMPFHISGEYPKDVRALEFCGNCLALEKGHSLLAPFRLSRFSQHKVVSISAEQNRWLNQLFDQIEDHQDRRFPALYDVLKSQLILVLHEVSKLFPVNAMPERSRNVEHALQFIEGRYRDGISLQQVAEHVHWSAPHLANKMKAETGRSVGEWLQTFRLADACAQLGHSKLSVQEIALSVGYQDTTHFIRHFKRAYQQTPAAWRKAHTQ